MHRLHHNTTKTQVQTVSLVLSFLPASIVQVDFVDRLSPVCHYMIAW